MEAKEYEIMAELEEKHWWFVARRKIITSMLEKVNLPQNAKILEVGCGSGGNLETLAKFGEVYAIEPNDEARERAEKRGIAKAVEKVNLPEMAFADERFDLIVLLDCLEHIDQDHKTLEALLPILKETGILFVTVPAFQFLWSQHDVACHHVRRYGRHQLFNIAKSAGYRPQFISYFNFWLFPAVALVRGAQKIFKIGLKKESDLKMPNNFLNNLLEKIFASERFLLGKMSLPFGVSLMLSATKN